MIKKLEEDHRKKIKNFNNRKNKEIKKNKLKMIF